jgi:hypothetical protein
MAGVLPQVIDFGSSHFVLPAETIKRAFGTVK